MSLPAILAAMKPTPDGFTATIPPAWMQGRTSYGGLSTALALTAAQRLAQGSPPLRSATVNFVGPLAGEVTVRARLLRQGRNATWASAEIESAAGVGLTATFVFMGPVESTLHLHDVPPPAGLIAPEDAAVLPEVPGNYFTGNFDRRFALPRSAEPVPELCWWVRAKERSGLDPMVELVLCADALPPGVLPLLGRGTAVSSMTWIVNLLTPLPQTRDNWWLVRAAGNYAEAGCSSQDMGMWNADGVAVTAGMQSIALFG
ncbi:MAG TPA: thioesterase family protein [Novosphingobium sp.]|nr:thioesterase family protein [Novosphingobium sp.]